jgi:hypothetical protein
MQTINNSELSSLFSKPAGEYLKLFCKTLGWENKFSRFEDTLWADIFSTVQKTATEATQKEMADLGPLFASEPSRYLYRFIVIFTKNVADAMKTVSSLPNYSDLMSGHKEDFEKDIELAQTTVDCSLKAQFQNELAYWSALENRQYADAKTFLEAVKVTRRDGELLMRVEILNWELNLSSLTGDIETFLGVFRNLEEDEICLNIDGIRGYVGNLLKSRGIKHVQLALTKEGLRKAHAHPQGVVAFGTEHSAIFIRSLVAQITNELLTRRNLSPDVFRKIYISAVEDSKRSFLAVSPYVQDLIIPNL